MKLALLTGPINRQATVVASFIGRFVAAQFIGRI